jgi:TetR/AcrR family transcriptional repressor of bet genes
MSGTVAEKGLKESSSAGKRRQIRPKAERRQQLIDATIRCIAQQGLSAITLQMVTREAGLSVGIANLHFQSKDNLLRETLRFVAEEYHGGQIRIMEGTAIANLGRGWTHCWIFNSVGV